MLPTTQTELTKSKMRYTKRLYTRFTTVLLKVCLIMHELDFHVFVSFNCLRFLCESDLPMNSNREIYRIKHMIQTETHDQYTALSLAEVLVT